MTTQKVNWVFAGLLLFGLNFLLWLTVPVFDSKDLILAVLDVVAGTFIVVGIWVWIKS